MVEHALWEAINLLPDGSDGVEAGGEEAMQQAVAALYRLRLPVVMGPGLWFGHDMRVWPPTNIGPPAPGQPPPTFSWLYMPLLLDALGHTLSFPFLRPRMLGDERWVDLVARLRTALQREGYDLDWFVLHADGPSHLPAHVQNHLVNLDAYVGQYITQVAWDMSLATIASPLPNYQPNFAQAGPSFVDDLEPSPGTSTIARHIYG